jgi:hypothetical protein
MSLSKLPLRPAQFGGTMLEEYRGLLVNGRGGDMAQVVESATSLNTRAPPFVVRRVRSLLVVGAIVMLSACGANEKGGSHGLGLQDVVGSAAAGACVTAREALGGGFSGDIATHYCGPYAKQWCKDHPGVAPDQGSCDGVAGWSAPVSSSSGSAGAGGSPDGSSGSSQSGATPANGSANGGSSSSQSSGSQNSGSPNGSSGAQNSGSQNSGSQSCCSQNSGSQNSGTNSGTNYGPGNGYVP